VIVAIDGPAGAGKSSVARAVAERLGFDYVDTGAMYRAVALAVREAGLDPSDDRAVGHIARSAVIEADGNHVVLDGRSVVGDIRSAEVTAAASTVAALPSVRAAMAERQRAAARRGNVVMEGRDIGSVVAPEAEVKVFVTASLDERARRRLRQIGAPEDEGGVEAMARSLAARDAADSTRAESPLVRPAEAIEIDTTDMTLDEVVDAVVELVTARRG
jgi:cytidylate kinase